MNRRYEMNERNGRRKDRVGVALGLVGKNLYSVLTGFFHQDPHPGMGGFEINEEMVMTEPLEHGTLYGHVVHEVRVAVQAGCLGLGLGLGLGFVHVPAGDQASMKRRPCRASSSSHSVVSRFSVQSAAAEPSTSLKPSTIFPSSALATHPSFPARSGS